MNEIEQLAKAVRLANKIAEKISDAIQRIDHLDGYKVLHLKRELNHCLQMVDDEISDIIAENPEADPDFNEKTEPSQTGVVICG